MKHVAHCLLRARGALKSWDEPAVSWVVLGGGASLSSGPFFVSQRPRGLQNSGDR